MGEWGICAVCSDVIEPGAVTCVSLEFAGWPTIRFHVVCYVGFVRFADRLQPAGRAGPGLDNRPARVADVPALLRLPGALSRVAVISRTAG